MLAKAVNKKQSLLAVGGKTVINTQWNPVHIQLYKTRTLDMYINVDF